MTSPNPDIRDIGTHSSVDRVWWEQTQPRPWQGSLSAQDLSGLYQTSHTSRQKITPDEGTSRISPRRCKSLASQKAHGETLDLSHVPCDRQTIRTSPNSPFRPSSFVSVADPEAHIAHYVDDKDILQRISRLLRSRVTSRFGEISGPHDKSSGVEIAINAYRRGECSTGELDQALLPPGLHSRRMEDLSARYYDDELNQPDSFCDLCSLYAAATGRKSMARTERVPFLMDETLDEEYDPKPDVQETASQLGNGWTRSHGSHRFFDGLMENIGQQTTRATQDLPPLHQSVASECRSMWQVGPEPPLASNRLALPANGSFRSRPLHSHPRVSSAYSAVDEDIPFSKTKPPRPLPITPERLQMLRLQLPQPHHVRQASFHSSGQSHIHPALRSPSTTLPSLHVSEDYLGDTRHGGGSQWSGSNAPSSSAKATQLDDGAASPFILTIPTSASSSPLGHFFDEAPELSSQDLTPEAASLEGSENSCAVERELATLPPPGLSLWHLAYNSFARSESSRQHSPFGVEDFYHTKTELRQTALERSCLSDSEYPLRRMLGDIGAEEEITTDVDNYTRVTLSAPSTTGFQAAEAHRAYPSETVTALPGTMLGDICLESSIVVQTPNIPQPDQSAALKNGPRSRRKRLAKWMRKSSTTIVADDTSLRAHTYLYSQGAPLSIQPQVAASRMTFPNHPSVALTSSKLARFFGEDYSKLMAKDKEDVRKTREHDDMIRQLLGGSKRRMSGISENMKKGLKRLLG
ncbi:MAG: hypothetical protein Q9163_004690 [Psora crenata]